MAILCPDLKLLFLCAPKTACTAVAEVLVREFGGIWLPTRNIHDSHGRLIAGRKHSTLPQLLRARIVGSAQVRDWTVMTTTRNPFDWIVSKVFYERAVYEREGENSTIEWVQRSLGRLRDAATCSFEEHVLRFYSSPGSSVAGQYTCGADVVMRYENLQEELGRALHRLGVTQAPEIPMINVSPDREADYRVYYSERGRSAVEVAFASDLSTYQYSFDDACSVKPRPSCADGIVV